MSGRAPQPFRDIETAIAERGAALSTEIAALEELVDARRDDVAELRDAIPGVLDAHGPPDYVFFCSGFGIGALLTMLAGLLLP